MTGNDYQKLAERTINKDLRKWEQREHALHGMVGEVGEIHSIYQKTYQGQWIQVEEKLPEDGVTVLTCDNHENIHVMKHYNFCEYPFDIGPEHERYYMPKAWMPLPEPYKESEK